MYYEINNTRSAIMVYRKMIRLAKKLRGQKTLSCVTWESLRATCVSCETCDTQLVNANLNN